MGALPAVELAHSRVRLCALGHGPIWLPSDQSTYSCSQYRAVLLHKSLAVINCFVRIRKNRQLNLSAAFSALLFGIHPLRVESVAWVTERRDVLSGLFYLLTIYAYLRAANVERTHSRRWLSLACVTYASIAIFKGNSDDAAGHLILLDIYPLRRFKGRVAEWFKPEQRGVWFEKVPFLILACGFALIALSAQRSVGALKTLAQYELPIRLGQTFYGVFGIGKSIFPVQLSPLLRIAAAG